MTGFVLSRTRRKSSSLPATATPEQGFRNRDKVLRNTLLECRDVPSYVLEIQKLWDDAAESFLTIGRYLVQAKQNLKHGEFEQMIRHELPFDKNVAHRLRRVAEDIDKGRLDASKLPRNYTTIYRFVTMNDALLERAQQEGVMHPEVTHRQIHTFLRQVRDEQMVSIQAVNYNEVTDQYSTLRKEISALEKILEEKRGLLRKIEDELKRSELGVIEGTKVF
ncbi:DUF3102 domain-containing protein [Teichococcus wenyumeiae]|nr:DUF3102 domain-containing protein [Pseudoroseomonas wenyumeiae]